MLPRRGQSLRALIIGRVTQLENPLLCSPPDALASRTSARAQHKVCEEISGYEA